jgi:endoglucanase
LLKIVVLYAAIFIWGSIFSQTGSGFFKTQGTEIVDSSGAPVLFRGVGLGGWLVPEGYMLKIPGYGSPSYIDSLVEDLIGPQNRDQFWAIYEANHVDRIDIEYIAQWGYNSIRLPFHYKVFWDPDSNNFREKGFALVDTLLQWCEQYDLYMILDMHCAPGGQNKDNISDSDGIEARLWTDPANQQLTFKIWKGIAQRYVNEYRIVGFDLINEPVLPQGYSNSVLRNFYIQLTDTIRSVDANHIVFIEGNWYATDFNFLTPPFDNNMVYSFHKYWNQTTIGTIQYLLDIRNQYDVPLWMGESGENSNPWFYETIQLFEQNNIGWNWWTHKKIETITSPLSAPITSDYQTVLNYWNNQGPRPSLDSARNALFGMAQNLALNLCESRPGVLKALFDTDFGTIPKPFTQLTIPGTINAVHYDFGTNAVGYLDTDYKNVGGPGGGSWNNGSRYRNDGVDIEKSSDPQGYAYNVGWVEAGEWLRYTVNVATTGSYRADIRVASASGGGQIRLYFDSQPAGNIVTVPNTGGWQNWNTIRIDSVEMTAGMHELFLSFPTGGFNINRVNFFLTSTNINNNGNDVPKEYGLKQNYPNPFNPETTISYNLPESAYVELKIFDLRGRQVGKIVEGQKSPGVYRVKFDGSRIASGLYLYRINAGDYAQTRKMVLVR